MAIVPIILAAGASTRMGQPKALLGYGGRTALARLIAVFREAGCARPIVVLGSGADEIERTVRKGEARVVVNPDWERGQTSSLKAGLRVLPPEAVAWLLHPVDVPLIEAADVAAVTGAWAATGKPIVIPSHAMRRGHPVLFSVALRDEVMVLGDGDPVRNVVNADPERVHHVECHERVLWDADSPGEYQRLKSRMEGDAAE